MRLAATVFALVVGSAMAAPVPEAEPVKAEAAKPEVMEPETTPTSKAEPAKPETPKPAAVKPEAPKPGKAKIVEAGPTQSPDEAFAAGQWAVAEAGYAEQVHARPDAPRSHYRRAVAAALAGHPQQAEASAATVVRLDPGNEPAILLAAGARALRRRTVPVEGGLEVVLDALADGRLRTAARLAARALADPGNAEHHGALHLARGRALLALDRADEAAVSLKAAAGLGMHTAALWLAVGRSFLRRGSLDAARASFEAVLGTAESSALITQARAQLAAVQRLRVKR